MTKVLMVSNPGIVDFVPTATVEAEFGSAVLEGAIVTMAHHGDRYENPAPCNWPYIGRLLTDDDRIVISHIDLDTIGGIMALVGVKPADEGFWAGTEIVDVHGPHHAHELPQRVQDYLNAYYAWVSEQPRAARLEPDEIRDVTADVSRHIGFLKDLLIGGYANKEEIEAGRQWAAAQREAVESRLVHEDKYVRVFITDGAFCNGGYYSPTQECIVPACVVLNTRFNAITVSFTDEALGLSAEKIVQAAWGPLAGGRAGIAGSPRGQVMTEVDLGQIAKVVAILVKQAMNK